MEKIIHSAVHNRFDIEVTDSVTGELKQKVTSYNIILEKFFTQLINRSSKLGYIHIGTGTGTPATTDTSMFQFLGYKGATVVDIVKAYPTSYIRKKIVLSPSEFVGANITEVGFAHGSSASYAVTHSMLKDSEGNQIAIQKTDTDVLTIYATFYITIGEAVEGVYVLPTPENNAIIKAALQDDYPDSRDPFYATIGMSNLIETADELQATGIDKKYTYTITGDLANKRWNIPTLRWDFTQANGHMISAVGCPTVAAWLLPNEDIFPQIALTNVNIGLGDGEKTEFQLPLPLIAENTEQIRVDGVLQTKGVDYTIDYQNNAIEYPELFASADPNVGVVTGGYRSAYDRYPIFNWGIMTEPSIGVREDSPIMIDFGEDRLFNRLIIPYSSFTKNYGGGTNYSIMKLSYSSDGEVWNDVFEYDGSIYEMSADEWFEPPITARYWKLSTDNTTGCGGDENANIQLGYVTPGLIFTTPPADGAAIEMDCKLDRPIKNENWVLDFSFSVQFERG